MNGRIKRNFSHLPEFLAAIGLAYTLICGLFAGAAQAQAGGGSPGQASRAERPVLVFAAASLRNALSEVIAAHEARTGHKIVASYAGSNALARQIEHGAPADIFVSADLDWMDYLAKRKFVRNEDVVALLRNALVVIAPAGKAEPLDLAKPGELLRRLAGGRLAIAETGGVPAGRYAKSALETFGIWNSVGAHLAQVENVRAALLFVARGEVPLGIVYASDAKAEAKTAVVAAFPAESHPPIVYPAALAARSQHPRARAFFAFLSSAEAAALFEKHGFAAPGKSGS